MPSGRHGAVAAGGQPVLQRHLSRIGYTTATFIYQNPQRLAGRPKWGSRRLLNYGINGLLSYNNRPLRLVNTSAASADSK